MQADSRSETETVSDAPKASAAGALSRLGLTIAFIVMTALLVKPFLPALTWAVVLAVVFARLHRTVAAQLRPSAAAGVSVAIIALIVVAPLLLVSQRLVTEALSGVTYVQDQIATGGWQVLIDSHPWLRDAYVWLEQQIDLKATLQRVTAAVANLGADAVKQSTGQLFGLVITFYMLFFLLRDRQEARAVLDRLSPFTPGQTDMLVRRACDTINATIYGTLAVAALQGALGGLMFWWLGVPSPVLWGVIMATLSVVPVLGSFVIWAPAAIGLALDDRWSAAAILAAWGVLVIGTADNFLRPLLMGEALRLHTATLFISMIGGLSLFGAAGVVLGPIIVTTTMLMLSFWRRQEET